jgi:hypothetical protein
MKSTRLITALEAVTATTTSAAIKVRYAKKVTLMFKRADHSAGSTAFTVTGSLDGETFITLNNLVDNVTNNNSQTLTRVGSVTLSADTSKVYALDLDKFGFKEIKVTATETTDGTHTALVLIEE